MGTELDKFEFLINRYEELIARKAELNVKLLDLSKLMASYGESDIESKKESLALVNEYAAMINEIVAEAESFDVNRVNQFKDFFATRARYNMISKEIQAAEKLSLKSKGSKSETVNAEGRRKLIDDELLDEYQDLVAQKKGVSNQMRYFYNKIRNIDIDDLKKEVNNVKTVTVIATPTTPFEFKETEFFDLPLDIQIKETEDRIGRILAYAKTPGLGKKRLIEYNGEKIDLPISLYGQLSQTKRLLSKLMRQKREASNETVVTNQTPNTPVQSAFSKDTEVQANQTQNVLVQPAVSNNDDKQINQIISESKADEQVAVEGITGGVYSVDEIIEEVNNGFPNSVISNLSEVEAAKLQPIKGIKKAKSKKVIKERIKKAIIGIVAAAIVLTSSVAISKFFKSMNNSNSFEEFPQEPSISDVVDNEKPADNNNDYIEPEISVGNNEKVEFQLGDIVSIDTTKPIYSKMEDACNQTNPLEHYYKDNDDRVIEAITLVTKNPEGKEVYQTIWNFDPEANEKIDLLRQMGAETKGVVITKVSLSGQNLGYEGYKAVPDVTKKVIQGKGR